MQVDLPIDDTGDPIDDTGDPIDDTGDTGDTGWADTCNPGPTMTDIGVQLLDVAAVGTHVQVTYSQPATGPGSLLPPEYFATVAPRESAPSPLEALSWVGDGVIAAQFPGLPDREEQVFEMIFPDRREWIDCTHPGMDDRYIVSVTMMVGSDGLELLSTTETVDYGDI